MTQSSKKHHFVPKCYLKAWGGVDSKVCEYQRLGGSVKTRRIHPSGTGYEIELYKISTTDPDAGNRVEDEFLKNIDQLASNALDIFLGRSKEELTREVRDGWTRFVMSMLQRNPEKLAENHARMLELITGDTIEFEEEYQQGRRSTDPPTLTDAISTMDMSKFDNMGAWVLPHLSNLPGVGQTIVEMKWSTKTLENGHRHNFLTSDSPVCLSNGLANADAHVLLPLSPTTVFVATKNDSAEMKVREVLASRDGVRRLNAIVANQAKRFVYGRDDSQVRFVENRLGRGRSGFE